MKTGLEEAIGWVIDNAFNVEQEDIPGVKLRVVDYEDFINNIPKWKSVDENKGMYVAKCDKCQDLFWIYDERGDKSGCDCHF